MKKSKNKEFYKQFSEIRDLFKSHVCGIDNENDLNDYTGLVLSRMIVNEFLSTAGLSNNTKFHFPLFDKHELEIKYEIKVDDCVYEKINGVLSKWNFELDSKTWGNSSGYVTPDVLGNVFEQYINDRSGVGAYYTPDEITKYMCENTIIPSFFQKIENIDSRFSFKDFFPDIKDIYELTNKKDYKKSIEDVISKINSDELITACFRTLISLSVVDPSCGSGAFLIASVNQLIWLYELVVSASCNCGNNIDPSLMKLRDKYFTQNGGSMYHITAMILTYNIYGVDIMPDAVEIAKVRLYLLLLSMVDIEETTFPFPDLSFNLLSGNSLIGFTDLEDVKKTMKKNDGLMFDQSKYKEIEQKITELCEKKNQYRHLQANGKKDTTLKQWLIDTENYLNNTLNEIFEKQYGLC